MLHTLRILLPSLLALMAVLPASAAAQLDEVPMTPEQRRQLVALGYLDEADGGGDEQAEERSPRVVELVISGDASEDPKPINPLGPTRRNFLGRLEQIRAIAADPTVDGVKLEVKGLPGLAKTLDLMVELQALKDAGKTLVCYSEMVTRAELIVGSLADQFVVPPSGMIILEGFVAEAMYYKDLLDMLDVKVEVLHIGDYKTAYENFARNGMSPGQREVLQVVLDEYYDQVRGLVAGHRGLDPEVVDGFFGQVFVDPADAARAGLIDAVAYEDEFEASLEALFGGEPELIEDYGDRTKEDIEKMLENPFALMSMLPDLLDPPKPELPDEPYVGVVYCSGTIVSGKSQADFQGNVASMGSDTIVAALNRLGEDEHCQAVVLRVNSPGGSALASDMIWQAIQQAKKHKPVISSMGSVAASGGYWISMGCNAIVAQPSTLTGSIGVVSMLPDVSATLERFGVDVEVVTAGPGAEDLALMANGPSERLKASMTRWMEVTYQEFLGKVSKGRGLPVERVHELAQGRVWTGRQAAEVGLVDELGSYSDALALACVMGGLEVGECPVVELPEAPNMFEQFEESLGVLTRTPGEQLLIELGYGELVDDARALLGTVRGGLGPDSVQAVLPWRVLIR